MLHFAFSWLSEPSARIVIQKRLLCQVYCAAQCGSLVHGLVVLSLRHLHADTVFTPLVTSEAFFRA